MDEEDEEEVYGDFEDLETGKVWIMIRRIAILGFSMYSQMISFF